MEDCGSACLGCRRMFLLRPLTYHLSYHLLEQPNQPQCQVSSLHQGSLSGRQKPSPLSDGVFYLKEAEGHRNVLKCFGDPFSQG